jgi:hypothetical protein
MAPTAAACPLRNGFMDFSGVRVSPNRKCFRLLDAFFRLAGEQGFLGLIGLLISDVVLTVKNRPKFRIPSEISEGLNRSARAVVTLEFCTSLIY